MKATRSDVVARFWAKVDKSGDCWNWTAATDRYGYGLFWPERRTSTKAHRFSYELAVGEIRDGLVVDHLCRNRRCVNPSHLEPVTSAENTRRGIQPQKGKCLRGHVLVQPNLVASKMKAGHRNCLACARAAAVVYRTGGDIQAVSDEKYRAIVDTLSTRT
ncbi:HNH endonuclease [Rhodococcus hoagii]|nr:HNH endonuclease [Prescottella equi]NKR53021.1 HNH endonuclease [Prescottella equi]